MSAADREAENSALRQRVRQLEAELAAVRTAPPKWDLELAEYTRYGRQLIMPEIGLEGACVCVCVWQWTDWRTQASCGSSARGSWSSASAAWAVPRLRIWRAPGSARSG